MQNVNIVVLLVKTMHFLRHRGHNRLDQLTNSEAQYTRNWDRRLVREDDEIYRAKTVNVKIPFLIFCNLLLSILQSKSNPEIVFLPKPEVLKMVMVRFLFQPVPQFREV